MLISRIHPLTGLRNTIKIDISEEQLAAWQGGKLIQDVAPNLSADEREFIISGIHNWDQIFSAPLDDKEELLAANNDGISIKTAPEYRPPSKRLYRTKNFRPDKLRQLRLILKYLSPQIILAGGSLRTILNRAHENGWKTR